MGCAILALSPALRDGCRQVLRPCHEAACRCRARSFGSFVLADPQGGDSSLPIDNRCRMKIHNAFVEESVALANKLKIKPAFAMILGDVVDHEGDPRDFYSMHQYLNRLLSTSLS